jgi:DedD protein
VDDGLKRRLVGASALAVVALILTPFIIPNTQDARYLAKSVPDMPQANFAQPADAKTLSIPVSQLINPDDSSSQDGQSLPEQTIVQVPAVQVDNAKVPATSFVKPVTNAEGQALAWLIQVGSFSSVENANTLRDKLRKAGYNNAYSQRSNDGKLTRVFVGPSTQRAELERTAAQIALKFDIKGQVLPVQPR